MSFRHCRNPLAWLALAALVLHGCKNGSVAGYSAEELFPPNVTTVSVSILENRDFYRDVEFDLTEALIKEIELRTPYKVVRHADADTELTGTILSVREGVVSRSFDGGLPQEVRVTVALGFEWKDLRNGQVIRKRDRIVGEATYAPTRPMSQPFRTARHSASSDLAREVVSVMRDDW